MESNASQKLNSSEWFVVLALLAVLLVIAIGSKIQAVRENRQLASQNAQIEKVSVEITGAVQAPGIYELTRGEPLKVALKKAKLKKNTYIHPADPEELVQNSMKVNVSELKEVRVWIAGEVLEGGVFVVKNGTRISDLKGMLRLTGETDLKFFKRKKILSDGEKIVIPKKTVEGK